ERLALPPDQHNSVGLAAIVRGRTSKRTAKAILVQLVRNIDFALRYDMHERSSTRTVEGESLIRPFAIRPWRKSRGVIKRAVHGQSHDPVGIERCDDKGGETCKPDADHEPRTGSR